MEKKVESFKDIVEQQLREEIKDLADKLRKEFTIPMNDEFEGVNKKT